MIAGALFTLGDYARFVGEISDSRALNSSHAERRDAEAVVVLTGGANRISAGLKLLRENHGRRLLISGVSATTTRSDLGRILNDNIMMFGCCIDLDREARDTRGNAFQTAEWVRLHRFQKILLVTSSYHMPRSLMLLQEAMPNVDVVAVPILPPEWDKESVLDLAMSPIVMREYAKYRIAMFGFEPSVRRITSAFIPVIEKIRS